jgi:hypothetical protein
MSVTSERRLSAGVLVIGNNFKTRICFASACCSSPTYLSPSLRISFRLNGDLLVMEFILDGGLPARSADGRDYMPLRGGCQPKSANLV